MNQDNKQPVVADLPAHSEKTRINNALDLAQSYAGIDGSHHKQWLIAQMVKTLCGSEEAYKKWVEDYEQKDKDGEPTYEWDEGIVP